MTPTEIQRAFVLIVVMAGGAMALLDIAVVNVALPSIMVAVGANVVEVRWVVTAFMLCSALVMPITGWMGRRIGYGNLYIVSLAFFTAGSALCAVSWDLNSLVLARIVQG
ncbi:MAG: MFS transporter, partial [SAR324 cluster bacterium]|nr:MFS transporter [SAR324 cluster bacterium]